MEISDSSIANLHYSAPLMTERAVVVRTPAKPVSTVESSSSRRVIATHLAGSGESEVSIPLSSGADVRSVTLGSTSSGKTDDENTREGEALPDLAEPVNSENQNASAGSTELTSEEEEQIRKLKARDLEVRQHEQAHLAAAGSFASGGAQYEYQTGPDGKQYAIGGHVNIDTSEGATPQATIAKAQQIQRAAMAPADPSPQDVKVAAQATQMMLAAQRELSAQEADAGDPTEPDNAQSSENQSSTEEGVEQALGVE